MALLSLLDVKICLNMPMMCAHNMYTANLNLFYPF